MKSILVVEDDTDIRESLAEFLKDEGFDVVGAENGKVALEKLAGTADLPGLILLDIMMPVMDGLTFRRIQLSDPKTSAIPVAVTTAGSEIESILKEVRVADFLQKPVDLGRVLEVVTKYCL